MDEYKPNSHLYKENRKNPPAEKKVEKVVSGKVKTKKNDVRKFTDIFISEDINNVKEYVFMDVLVPAIKKAISDVVRDSIDMILYGESGRNNRKTTNGNYVSYRSYSDPRDNQRSSSNTRSASSRLNYEDIIFNTKGEAEAALRQMCDILDQYQVVTVADLYDMCDLTAPFTANNYGWTNLSRAYTDRVRDGYVIRLPRAVVID